MQLNQIDTNEMATKTTIGISGTIYSWLQDMPLSSWVGIATFAYMICQLIVIAPKVISTLRNPFRKEKEDEQG